MHELLTSLHERSGLSFRRRLGVPLDLQLHVAHPVAADQLRIIVSAGGSQVEPEADHVLAVRLMRF